MHRDLQAPSLLQRVLVSVLIGVAVAGAGLAVEVALGTASLRSLTFFDDLVVGVITGLVVFSYEQRHHRAVLEKISTIAAMNHHVRNALQAIAYAPYAEHARQIKLIEESVNRIQWALREILPGHMTPEEWLEDQSGK